MQALKSLKLTQSNGHIGEIVMLDIYKSVTTARNEMPEIERVKLHYVLYQVLQISMSNYLLYIYTCRL